MLSILMWCGLRCPLYLFIVIGSTRAFLLCCCNDRLNAPLFFISRSIIHGGNNLFFYICCRNIEAVWAIAMGKIYILKICFHVQPCAVFVAHLAASGADGDKRPQFVCLPHILNHQQRQGLVKMMEGGSADQGPYFGLLALAEYFYGCPPANNAASLEGFADGGSDNAIPAKWPAAAALMRVCRIEAVHNFANPAFQDCTPIEKLCNRSIVLRNPEIGIDNKNQCRY